MYAESPRSLILAGGLEAREIANLIEYCQRLHSSGQSDLKVDLSAVTSCDRAGLEGLTALAGGSTGLTISVEGAHWGQFLVMLGAAPVRDLQGLCDDVRSLLRPSVSRAARYREFPSSRDGLQSSNRQ